MSDFHLHPLPLFHNSHRPKKYSLRDCHHHRKGNKNDAECSFHSSQRDVRRDEVERATAERNDLKQELSMLASTFLDNSTFNLQ
jgi:hypothetical protein